MHERERDSLRIVRDSFFLWPLRGGNAPAEVLQFGFGHVHGEGMDRGVVSRRARSGNSNCFSVGGHDRFLCFGATYRTARIVVVKWRRGVPVHLQLPSWMLGSVWVAHWTRPYASTLRYAMI